MKEDDDDTKAATIVTYLGISFHVSSNHESAIIRYNCQQHPLPISLLRVLGTVYTVVGLVLTSNAPPPTRIHDAFVFQQAGQRLIHLYYRINSNLVQLIHLSLVLLRRLPVPPLNSSRIRVLRWLDGGHSAKKRPCISFHLKYLLKKIPDNCDHTPQFLISNDMQRKMFANTSSTSNNGHRPCP